MKTFNRRKVLRRVRNRRRTKIRNKKLRIRRTVAPSWYPFGKSRTCKLRYNDQITIDPSAGSVGSFVFAASGLYDPNISGTGHQPYGFDQLMALYNTYVVTGARIKINAIMPLNAEANAYPFMMGVKLSDQGNLNTANVLELFEQPGLRKRIVSNASSSSSNSLTCNYSARKFFRLKSKSFLLADDELKGSASANPFNNVFFIVCYAPVIAGGDLPSTTFHIQIDFCATFTGPKELYAS